MPRMVTAAFFSQGCEMLYFWLVDDILRSGRLFWAAVVAIEQRAKRSEMMMGFMNDW